MTPDGISSEEWDRIHELALSIVNAIDLSSKTAYKQRLLQALDTLEERYGALPSILATRADYVEDTADKVTLLRQAYRLATQANDERNALYVSTSLADLFWEELQDRSEAAYWLRLARSHLHAGDAVDQSQCDDLCAELEGRRDPPLD